MKQRIDSFDWQNLIEKDWGKKPIFHKNPLNEPIYKPEWFLEILAARKKTVSKGKPSRVNFFVIIQTPSQKTHKVA